MNYDPIHHKKVVSIIKKYSENKKDIRDIVVSKIDLSSIESILDLGCGYGSFFENISFYLKNKPLVVGVDINEKNKDYFLNNVEKIGCKGIFLQKELPSSLDFPDKFFDLIIAIYSLYFFTGMLPEIKRLLKNKGFFVAITHCEDSFKEINSLISDSRLISILKKFNDKNGLEILSKFFSNIETEIYKNNLIFSKNDLDDLKFYLNFKKPYWFTLEQELLIEHCILKKLEKENFFSITKNDIIYICKNEN